MSASGPKFSSRVWFIPVLCALGGVALSIATLAIDHMAGFDLVPRSLTGDPDAALGILTTIAASMVSLTALVLTITMVVVQLAMGQFSPRIVQTFLQDRPSQFAIGLFVATFAHAMIAMREVESGGDSQVPGLAIAVGYLLVLASIATLVLYVDHIGRSLRVSALIELVGGDTRKLIDRRFPEQLEQPPAAANVILAPKSGVLIGVDDERLVRAATEAECVLRLAAGLGEFVPAGAPLVYIDGPTSALDRDAVLGGLRSGLERTLDQDTAYGLRMLVDMAERSLSDSPFLDPTTAVQCIDRLHDALRQLAGRVIPEGHLRDEHGTVRVIVPTMDWDAYVHLAFDEIRLAGSESPQVSRRLMAALHDLLSVAPSDRHPPLLHQVEMLRRSIRDGRRDADDVAFAAHPDGVGIGVDASTRTRADGDGDVDTDE